MHGTSMRRRTAPSSFHASSGGAGNELDWHSGPGGGGSTWKGVTGLDGAETADVPALWVAWTVKVYGWPLVSPVTTADVAKVDTDWAPGLATTV
jgi:hypothetical protein